MKLYVGQQLNAGLDPATVRTRLEYLKQFRVSLVSPLTSLDNVDAHDLIVKLKRAKALQGGSKLKPLVTIQQLFSPLHTPARGGCAARWLTYQALWWCIICSGCRPNEMCDAVLLLTTTSLKVGYLHRKQNSMPGARKDEYLGRMNTFSNGQVLHPQKYACGSMNTRSFPSRAATLPVV